jgi:hypothetical protein
MMQFALMMQFCLSLLYVAGITFLLFVIPIGQNATSPTTYKA